MRRRTITVSTSHEDEDGRETDIEVEASFTPGEREVRYQRNGDPGWPATGPEIEIIRATDEYDLDWTERLLGDKDWLSRVETDVVEAAAEEARYAAADAADAACDAQRDREFFGE